MLTGRGGEQERWQQVTRLPEGAKNSPAYCRSGELTVVGKVEMEEGCRGETVEGGENWGFLN